MRSVTSFSEKKGWFNAALFRKNLVRFWPIWAVYTAVLFFLLPASIMTSFNWGGERIRITAEHIYAVVEQSPAIGAVFGLLAAMALFSYLMNSCSAQMFHCLPIRREGLFLTNWLSGLCFFLVPDAVIALTVLAVEWTERILDPRPVLIWFLAQTAVSMFFFCLAVFCGMFTGNILAMPIFYGIINFLAMGVRLLAEYVLNVLLVGYAGGSGWYERPVKWLTPLYHLSDLLDDYHYTYSEALGRWIYPSEGPAAAVGYCLVVGLALSLLALEVYRRRQLERAGDLVTVGWVRPVFQYGVGICGGVCLGLVIYENFLTRFGPWTFILTTAVCAGIMGFAGRMLLKKTLRVFADGWKGIAVMAACLLLLLGGARADFFGYQRWVPQASEVVKAEVSDIYSAPQDDGNYASYVFTDPEDIAAVLNIHRAVTGHLDEIELAQRLDASNWSGSEYDQNGYEKKTNIRMTLRYTLADGTVEERSYQALPVTAEALTDPDSYASQIQALLNRTDNIRAAYFGNVYISDADDGVQMGAISADQVQVVGASIYDTVEGGDITLGAEDARKLWEAVQEDLDAGRIGRRYLLDSRERAENCYISDICFSLAWVQETVKEGQSSASSVSANVTITPQKSAASTRKALEEMGVLDQLRDRGPLEEPEARLEEETVRTDA